MSSYIDADAFKKEVEDFPNCYNGWSDAYDKAFIIGAIEEQPTIDLIRCKECKWADFYTTAEKEQYCYCLETDRGGRTADDFCSYGERRE